MYVHAANNKRPETVRDCFNEAVGSCGWPTRIRTDKGGENIIVGRMITERREGSGILKPHLVGSSVHNQRIERLWVDVRHCVSQSFIDLYEDLFTLGEYCRDCSLDFFCAQLVFIPALRAMLEKFKVQWNNHSLSTEHQKTPNQLYVAGTLNHARSNLLETNEILGRNDPFDIDDLYGVEEPSINNAPEGEFIVPVGDFAPTGEQQIQIDEVIASISFSDLDAARRGYFRLKSLISSF